MIFMIRITIETNDKTGIGYQLHLKDDRQHREWIARDDKNGWPGGKPFLDFVPVNQRLFDERAQHAGAHGCLRFIQYPQQ